MRTTVNISEQLYRNAKARAATTGQTVSEVIEDALREALRPKAVDSAPVASLPTFGGSGVLAGIDLSNSGSRRDAMDDGAGLDALR